jgi:hypothetical protein
METDRKLMCYLGATVGGDARERKRRMIVLLARGGGEVVGAERKTTVFRFSADGGPRQQKTSDRRFLNDAI